MNKVNHMTLFFQRTIFQLSGRELKVGESSSDRTRRVLFHSFSLPLEVFTRASPSFSNATHLVIPGMCIAE